jgi:chemosensory pili system protein ChpA (sensor histidine kinase/response regulator)
MNPTGGKLLVVDDTLANREVLSRHLVRGGYQVEQAVDGVQALQALATHDIDLMLLDIHMPRLDGFEVLEQMRGNSRLGEVPVIVISSDRELESVVRCI